MAHRTGGRFKAFTLIELLVVVAIIALLISILLPSLSAARSIARTVKCSAGLKQFGVAHQEYANENADYFVPLRYNGTDIKWFRMLKFRAMMGMVPGNFYPEALICPEVPADQAATSNNAIWVYGMNNSTGAPDRPVVEQNMPFNRGDMLVGNSQTGTGPLLRISRAKIVQPSEKLLMIDASNYMANRANSDFNTRWDLFPHTRPGPTTPWDGPHNHMTAYRHKESANVLFTDGHAETRGKKEVWHVNASGGPNNAPSQRLWFVYKKN